MEVITNRNGAHIKAHAEIETEQVNPYVVEHRYCLREARMCMRRAQELNDTFHLYLANNWIRMATGWRMQWKGLVGK